MRCPLLTHVSSRTALPLKPSQTVPPTGDQAFKYPSLWGDISHLDHYKIHGYLQDKNQKLSLLRIQEYGITGRSGHRDPPLKTGKGASEEDRMLEDRPKVQKRTWPQACHPAPSAGAAISNSMQVYKRENNCTGANGWPGARTCNNSFLPTLCLQEIAWGLSLRPCINLKKWPRVEFIF